ncbi:hypothetical protein TWF730_005001 [Orbilia blumenaviensis]|uniref:Uncharacterized protein n=1 Tax=Orbilia blumenaviensis TaxID=1796055 RepID=A0AAV9VJT7_9PEZI
MVHHSTPLTSSPSWSLGQITSPTSNRRRFASINEVIARAMAADRAVSPSQPVPAPAPSKIKGLIETWSQRAEPPQAVPKKSSLTGLKHLGPKHVQNRVQQFSRPSPGNNEISKIGGGFVKRRIAALEDIRAACQYALDRQQGNDRPRKGQPGPEPTVATPAEPAPSPDHGVSTLSDIASPDSLETESKALMREIEGMDIMSSACPTLHPTVRAPTEAEMSVGSPAAPPLTGTARVFGTRSYRCELLTEERLEIQAATKVSRRLVSDTHWLKARKPAAAFPTGTTVSVVAPTIAAPTIVAPARRFQGAQSLRKATSQLPIAKYYTNNYDPENNGNILPLRQLPLASLPSSLPSAPAPLDNADGFIEYKVASRFGIFGARPRLVARPRLRENLSPSKARRDQDTPTFPRVPKLRRRTPPEATADFFDRVWPNGFRKPSH